MLLNYIKIAFRNLKKQKSYSLINVLGLAIAISVFSVIFLYITAELDYDKHHKNGDRIYRMVEIQTFSGFGKNHVSYTMGPLAPALKADFPDVVYATRLTNSKQYYCCIEDKEFLEDDVCYTDPDFLTMFTIPLVKGDYKTALNEPNSVIIREEITGKYFGNTDPIGQSIEVDKTIYKITGVMETEKNRSHMKYNMLLSISSLPSQSLSSWFSNNYSTYVMMENGVSVEEFQKKLPEFLMKYRKIESDWQKNLQLYLQPLKKIHLYSKHILFDCHNYNPGNITNIQIFSLIALLIILIAVFNFVNLSTSKATQRTKEICVRKVCGSNRRQLIFQFWTESILLSVISFAVTIILIRFWLPVMNSFLSENLQFSLFNYFTLFLMNVFVGLVAGVYPALYLSKFQPSHVMKKITNTGSKAINLRKVLVVAQFAISIFLIASTILIFNQRRFIQTKELGYNKENVLFMFLDRNQDPASVELLKKEFIKYSNIISAAATSKPNGGGLGQSTYSMQGQPDLEVMLEMSSIDYDFIETMDMEVIEGRNFSKEFPTDPQKAILFNEAAAEAFGRKDIIGKQLAMDGWGLKNPQIIGVVKNFHFYSLHKEIKPLMFMMSPSRYRFLVVNIAPNNIPNTIEYLKDTWTKIVPNRPFKFEFLDERLDQQYRAEENMNQLFSYFAALAIFISCLGLLGLSGFTAEQRTKEIGVRKVLGSTVTNIWLLLTHDYFKWVGISSLIALPLGWYAMHKWLQNFAYRIDLTIWPFLLAGLAALAIALLTVSWQAIRVATANPVEALRYE